MDLHVKETEFEFKYRGGREKELAWIAAVNEKTYNKPVYEVLWGGQEEQLEIIDNPPVWKAKWKRANKVNRWAKVVKFGTRYFPNIFTTKTPEVQASMAVGFKQMIWTCVWSSQ